MVKIVLYQFSIALLIHYLDSEKKKRKIKIDAVETHYFAAMFPATVLTY